MPGTETTQMAHIGCKWELEIRQGNQYGNRTWIIVAAVAAAHTGEANIRHTHRSCFVGRNFGMSRFLMANQADSSCKLERAPGFVRWVHQSLPRTLP